MSAPVLDPARGLAAVDVERVRRRGFKAFVRAAWPQVEPAPLRWSWHLDAVCEHLEAVQRREVRELVINIPPGMSKSLMCSVLFPAWVWTEDPAHRFITASYADDVAHRDARKTRTLVESGWWRDRWPRVALPRDASASKAVSSYSTTAGGGRFSVTVRGSVTGQHADTHVIDDPIDPMGAAMPSGVELEAVLQWWDGTMSTRFRDHQRKATVLVMQRLHVRDLAGEMIRRGATVLCLPMRYERAHPNRYARDPRTEEGQLLDPDRFPEPVVKELEEKLKPSGAAAQLQQRPAVAGGEIVKAAWLRRYWTELPKVDLMTLSVDCAFKAAAANDLVSLQVWGSKGADHYLLDRRTEHLSFTETLRAIKAMLLRWPRITRKLVEDKANGTAVVDTLRSEIPGLILHNPGQDSKEGRLRACTPLFEAGNVILPHPERAEYPDGSRGAAWVRGGVVDLSQEAGEGSYEHALVHFPKASHDDDVDATSQYLSASANAYLARLRAAMEALKKGQTS